MFTTARTKKIFELFKREFNLEEKRTSREVDYNCYKTVVDYYKELCGFNVDRDIYYFWYFSNFCTKKINSIEAYFALYEICEDL